MLLEMSGVDMSVFLAVQIVSEDMFVATANPRRSTGTVTSSVFHAELVHPRLGASVFRSRWNRWSRPEPKWHTTQAPERICCISSRRWMEQFQSRSADAPAVAVNATAKLTGTYE